MYMNQETCCLHLNWVSGQCTDLKADSICRYLTELLRLGTVLKGLQQGTEYPHCYS
jgi:hypothetical protein